MEPVQKFSHNTGVCGPLLSIPRSIGKMEMSKMSDPVLVQQVMHDNLEISKSLW